MKPKTKRDKSVGRVMYSPKGYENDGCLGLFKFKNTFGSPEYLVLPLSNPEAIIERRAKAIHSRSERDEWWDNLSALNKAYYLGMAHATLVSDGWVEEQK